MLVVIAVAAALASLAGALAVRRWAPALGLVDVPNNRSSHARPTPRGGGLPLAMTALAGLFVISTSADAAWRSQLLTLGLSASIVAAVSLADDRWRLPVRYRLAAHGLSAVILVTGGMVLRGVTLPGLAVAVPFGNLAALVTVLWIVGFTNAYNFMDGIDGLATGQALVSAVTMGWLAHLYGFEAAATFMLLLAAATGGFLLVNWAPAKIFLGDVGSAFLGLVFAAWAVILSQRPGAPSFLVWSAVLSPFILDTLVTLARRVVRKEQWWEAHREHYYQRLIRCGWPHAPVTKLYVLMAATSGAAAILSGGYHLVPEEAVLVLTLVQFGALVVLVRRVEARARRVHN